MTTLRELWSGGCVSDACVQGHEPCPTPELCHRAANYRRVMAQPITREALGVEAALPASFTQDPPKEPMPPIDWQAVWVYGAVFVTFTAVMVLSAYRA